MGRTDPVDALRQRRKFTHAMPVRNPDPPAILCGGARSRSFDRSFCAFQLRRSTRFRTRRPRRWCCRSGSTGISAVVLPFGAWPLPVVQRFRYRDGSPIGLSETTGRAMATRHRLREFVRATSAPAERLHDLDAVPLGEEVFAVSTTGNDVAVDLDRHPAAGEALGGQKVGEGAGGWEGERGAVESDIHGWIVGGLSGPDGAPKGGGRGGAGGPAAHLSRAGLRETMPRPSGAVSQERRGCPIFFAFSPVREWDPCRSIVGPSGPSAIFCPLPC